MLYAPLPHDDESFIRISVRRLIEETNMIEARFQCGALRVGDEIRLYEEPTRLTNMELFLYKLRFRYTANTEKLSEFIENGRHPTTVFFYFRGTAFTHSAKNRFKCGPCKQNGQQCQAIMTPSIFDGDLFFGSFHIDCDAGEKRDLYML